jgi:hypothetical protein
VQVATLSTVFSEGTDGLWRGLLTTLKERAFDNELVLRRAITAATTAQPSAASPQAHKQTATDAPEPTPPTTQQLEDRQMTIIPEPAPTVYASFWWSAGDKREQAMLAESRYVYDRELSPMLVYEPDNELMGEVEVLMGESSYVNRTIQDLATRLFASGGAAVTPIEGFTFFQDANLQVREREYTGHTSVVLQQTFILPDPERGARFLEDLTASVRGDAELPTLCDVLWLPQDVNPFYLSATSQSGGFAITLTYLRPNDHARPTIQRELQALTGRCLLHGGRIHLVKGVEVLGQADLEGTYHEQFERFRALKAWYDPHAQFTNDFYRRVLDHAVPAAGLRPSLVCATREAGA